MIVFELRLKAKLWLYPGAGGWHFVTLPRPAAKQIKSKFGGFAKGWGSLPVVATIGSTSWKTSIFPDSKTGSCVLPIKADIRNKEKIEAGSTIASICQSAARAALDKLIISHVYLRL